jgi:hypothetical protein
MSEIPTSMSEVADYSASASVRVWRATRTEELLPSRSPHSCKSTAPSTASETTVRRRRPALARLGIRFLENGRGSVYATAEPTDRLPASYPPYVEGIERAKALRELAGGVLAAIGERGL